MVLDWGCLIPVLPSLVVLVNETVVCRARREYGGTDLSLPVLCPDMVFTCSGIQHHYLGSGDRNSTSLGSAVGRAEGVSSGKLLRRAPGTMEALAGFQLSHPHFVFVSSEHSLSDYFDYPFDEVARGKLI